jgi:surface polysaccharide O-acyltransferase-like enzyme
MKQTQLIRQKEHYLFRVHMTFETNSARPLKNHIRWIDLAKGIAIFLVVVFHLQATASIEIPVFFHHCHVVFTAVTFALPLFFFLSGFNAESSFQKGFWIFMKGKIAHIAYPYVVWSLLVGVLEDVFIRPVNEPSVLVQIIQRLWWAPYEHLWFIYALFFVFAYYGILRGIGLSVKQVLFVSLCLGIFLFIFEIATTPTELIQPMLYSLFNNLFYCSLARSICYGIFYFLLGVTMSLIQKPIQLTSPAFFMLSLVGYACAGFYHYKCRFFFLYTPVFDVLGIFSTVALCLALQNCRWLGWLTTLGNASMAIYVMHYSIIKITALYITNYSLLIVFGTCLGLFLPVIILKILQKYDYAKYFGFR